MKYESKGGKNMAGFGKITPTLPVVDIKRAKKFYGDILGCKITMEDPGPGAMLRCGDGELYLYQRGPSKADHTVASIAVDHIETEVKDLRRKGVKFEEYDIPSMGLKTVDGIATMGDMRGAWFKDSEGNVLSLVEMIRVKPEVKRGLREKVLVGR